MLYITKPAFTTGEPPASSKGASAWWAMPLWSWQICQHVTLTPPPPDTLFPVVHGSGWLQYQPSTSPSTCKHICGPHTAALAPWNHVSYQLGLCFALRSLCVLISSTLPCKGSQLPSHEHPQSLSCVLAPAKRPATSGSTRGSTIASTAARHQEGPSPRSASSTAHSPPAPQLRPAAVQALALQQAGTNPTATAHHQGAQHAQHGDAAAAAAAVAAVLSAVRAVPL
jgi:hypothetical protein